MILNKLKLLAQTVGFVVMMLFILSGALSFFTNARLALGAAQQAAALQTSPSNALVPTFFNYQGTLRNPEGQPLSGVHKLTFRIYKNVTDPLPEALWMEEHAEVTVRNGQFSVLLGDLNPIPPELFASSDRFIGITLAPFDEMTPRQRFASVPYAVASDYAGDAQRLGGKAPGDYALLGALTTLSNTVAAGRNSLDSANGGAKEVVYVAENGNIGINTKSPATMIHMLVNTLRMEFAGSWLDINTGGGWASFVSPGRLQLFAPILHLDASSVRVNNAAPVRILRFENVGNNALFNTFVPANQYYCVAAGWSAKWDIDENGGGTNAVWTFETANMWHARVIFSSHSGDDENPDVDILCFRREFASWEGAPTWLNDPN
jgi:hypothetical protein